MSEHKHDYAINHLKPERSRIATERDFATNNKDFDFASGLDWIVNGLKAAINLLEANRNFCKARIFFTWLPNFGMRLLH